MTLLTHIQALLNNNIKANQRPGVPLYETICSYGFQYIPCDLIQDCWDYLETIYPEEKLYE